MTRKLDHPKDQHLQIAESPPAPKRIAAPKGSVAKTPTTSSKTGADPPSVKETSKAKSAEILAPVVPTVGPNLGIPLPEVKGPPGPQQSPTIEYRGNAGVREASQVRAKKTMKGSTMRHPNAPTPLGKGTPSIPPVEAVGAYPTTSSTDKAVASQAQTAVSKESTPDRSRSRDPPKEIDPVVPQPQEVMNVPRYMLPIMAAAGVGHLTLDRSGTPSAGVSPPPKATQANPISIVEFFESLNQAQDREAQVKAIQQSAELFNEPQESASPPSQETANLNVSTTAGATEGRLSSPARLQDATAASRESSSPQETDEQGVPKSSSEGRGRPTMRERVSSYWPILRSFSGSDRRPRSPQVPPRPKAEPALKRANSLPSIHDLALSQADSGATLSTSATPITIVPAVQIPAPVAVESTTAQTAPEITSDAETLALPGLPGGTRDESNPSPVEEEVEPTTDDPYVSAVEDAASGEPVLTEAPPPETPMEPLREAATSISTGFGGLVQVIPKPVVPEVPSAKAGPVIKSTETASKNQRRRCPQCHPIQLLSLSRQRPADLHQERQSLANLHQASQKLASLLRLLVHQINPRLHPRLRPRVCP